MLIIKNRSSSFKEKKESPLRTQKASTKNDLNGSQFATNTKWYGVTNTKKTKPLTGTGMKTNQPKKQAFYTDHAFNQTNVVKNQNLSLNNFKTEMRLPQTQNFLAESQFAKSPFLVKTLKGLKQPTDTHVSNFGKIGMMHQSSTGRKQRDPSANSNTIKYTLSLNMQLTLNEKILILKYCFIEFYCFLSEIIFA